MVPVLCIDGPSGSGKGTLAQRLSEILGFHLLDSGALYRVVGYAALDSGIDWQNSVAVTQIARSLDVEFMPSQQGVRVIYRDVDVTDRVRSVLGGEGASAVAAIPSVREALLDRQRELARSPGLVADGRDMGTVVFPQAPLKVFLEASALARAQRRQSQLQQQGEDVSLPRLLEAIEARDNRDRTRSVSPLVPAEDAVIVDSTDMAVDAVLERVMSLVTARGIVRSVD
ncbi:MAG: (d)CMP kinase [Pseudomonadales bacterium]|jgi:cytidylate kinase|nr:(d)CMP kinase [Pseudomonadales bacterium]MDA0891301.1 (d)CMP kinase [Pseudomonadota bacterium]|tara:strand:+ start:51 stop:734 length:684 start_codon:yes stop_codon:yes gene_type:complete